MSLPLFNEPLIAGLGHREEFIGGEEEAQLTERLQALDLAPFRFQGWVGKRRTQSFGWRYDFEDASFAAADPLPDWLLPLRNKAAVLGRAVPDDFVHVLLCALRSRRWHRMAPRPPGVRKRGRRFAGLCRNPALPTADQLWLSPRKRSPRTAIRLSANRRRPPPVGA